MRDLRDLPELLRENPYPGRGIVAGRNRVYYFIMGRSENSRNRIFETTEDGLRTRAFDEARMTDPSLVIYRPVRRFGEYLIVTNGDQTDTIWETFNQESGIGASAAAQGSAADYTRSGQKDGQTDCESAASANDYVSAVSANDFVSAEFSMDNEKAAFSTGSKSTVSSKNQESAVSSKDLVSAEFSTDCESAVSANDHKSAASAKDNKSAMSANDHISAASSMDIEKAVYLFEKALRSRTYEPDAPHYTPRISALLCPDGTLALSILKRVQGRCLRIFYTYEAYGQRETGEAETGETEVGEAETEDAAEQHCGYFLSTYALDCGGTSNNTGALVSFTGEPVAVTMPEPEEVWNALNPENKVALYAYIDGKVRIFNKNLSDI